MGLFGIICTAWESHYSKHVWHMSLHNFSLFKKIWFFSKFTIKVGKTISGNKIIWCAFYSKLATLTDFGKLSVFWKIQFFLEEIKKNSTGLSKLHSTCPEETFEDIIFWKNYNFIITFELRAKFFWTFVKTFLVFWRKNFSRVVKTAFYVSIGTFWGFQKKFQT